MRAIVIDDSRAMRMILKRVLAKQGFECAEAGDGCEALAQLRTAAPPDLALVDWNMPNMNGFDFLCNVRGDRTFDSMKIMMVTTEVEMEQVARALGAGANEYLMKPFTEDLIGEKLEFLGFSRAVA